MIPKSLSATALQTAEACLSRYAAESLNGARSPGKSAATLGSACHGALENYVKQTIMATALSPTLKTLEEMFKISFMTEFGTVETDLPEYEDGWEMLRGWHKRTDFTGRTVLSAEVKENFPVPTSAGPIPFNYIIDRLDQTGPKEITVVDYKTNRWAVTPSDLHDKIQARCYALAQAIRAKQMGLDVERVWVVFDLLRHDPVGTVFSYEDNVKTWAFIRATAEHILNTPEENAPETLNAECNFCVRKVSCSMLKKNISVGGMMGLTFDQLIEVRTQMAFQSKAVKKALDEMDVIIEEQAKATDITSYETDTAKLKFAVSKRRGVDGARVAAIAGNDLFLKHGGKHDIGVGNFDKLIKDPALTPQQVRELSQLVFTNYGEPRVTTEARSPLSI